MKILAVDHGTKNIGLAISDPTGSIARPLLTIKHESKVADAARVVALADREHVGKIIVGRSVDDNGDLSLAGRQASRFAETLQKVTTIPVDFWDEAFSTSEARNNRLSMGVSRKKRSGHLDEVAAAIILQSYMDEHLNIKDNDEKNE